MLNRGKYLLTAATLILAFVCSLAVNGQGRGGVTGFLKDAVSGEALMYANVALIGTASGTLTDEAGNSSY